MWRNWLGPQTILDGLITTKPMRRFFCGLGRLHERADGIQNAGDRLVVSAELSLDFGFEFVQASGSILVAGDHLA